MRYLVLALVFVVASATPSAQPDSAEAIPAAEAAFQNGLASFRSGDFEEAHRLFQRAATEFDYHARSTAAILMSGRAAYAAGNTDGALAAANILLDAYPGSRYTEEAQALRATAQAGGGLELVPFDLGIVMPSSGPNGYLGQALFNGVRIAVDEHNERVEAAGPGAMRRQVRMVFRDTEGTPEGAATAAREVIAEGADALIGPLFSQGALTAAAVAEESAIPLLAPLANAEEVSANRAFVFQANPTFAERGRAMARYAVNRLSLDRLGMAAEANTPGAAMGEAFVAEARRLGAAIGFSTELANADDWADLDRRVGASQIERVDAVYLPVTGQSAASHAGEALRAIETLRRTPRPLGNTEWEALSSSQRTRASRLGSMFTRDFFVAPGGSDAFGRRYRELSRLDQPDRIALIGYDVARFVIQQMEASDEGMAQPASSSALADQIRRASEFQGTAHRFNFDGGQINTALFILAYRDGRAVLVE